MFTSTPSLTATALFTPTSYLTCVISSKSTVDHLSTLGTVKDPTNLNCGSFAAVAAIMVYDVSTQLKNFLPFPKNKAGPH